jgi:hypothetical protein
MHILIINLIKWSTYFTERNVSSLHIVGARLVLKYIGASKIYHLPKVRVQKQSDQYILNDWNDPSHNGWMVVFSLEDYFLSVAKQIDLLEFGWEWTFFFFQIRHFMIYLIINLNEMI